INPDLFNWDDLSYHADIARDNLCVPWLDADNPRLVDVPAEFALDPLWPNPFNARAHICFHVDRAGEVTVRAYDILGRTATEIARERFEIGMHTLSWDAVGLPSGVYFIEAQTQFGERMVQKAALVR
ncbi:MAG: T9SS type A sorting domain-containing protein, partial [bacterium]|nr:T9SS type A sorting domain-containing protein [bacterium]